MNKNIKLIINYVLGPLVFCILIYSIYLQIVRQPDLRSSAQLAWNALRSAEGWKISAVCVLMICNWGIEARKWQVAISKIQKISLFTAFKAILCGTTLAFFTPNRMGEYLGRIWFIEEGKRLQAISITVICSIAQLLVTLIAGIIGLYFIKQQLYVNSEDPESITFWVTIVQYSAWLAFVLLILFYFRLSWLVRLVEKLPVGIHIIRHIQVLDNFNATHLLRLLSLSMIRYLVFLVQYYVLFDVFEVEVNWWQSFWAISVVFLILAIVPTIAFLTELGIRWKASMELFRLYSSNMVGIFAASLAIWIINLVIPALIGSLLILGIKFFRSK